MLRKKLLQCDRYTMKLTISLVETKKVPKLINKKYAKGQMEEKAENSGL